MFIYYFLYTLFFSISLFAQFHNSILNIKKVVIWGHKLHSHTHSYIHEAFFNAFTHLGYKTYWFDDYDDISDFDFSRTLFLTEGQVDANIPILDDCFYILHNCNSTKYLKFINCGKAITLQVFTYDCITCCSDIIQKDEYVYESLKGHIIFMPWATDILPYQIEENKEIIKNIEKENNIYYVGSIGGGIFGNIDQIIPFQDACKEYRLNFINLKNINFKDHVSYIQKSFCAPSIVGRWQQQVGYIPCRVLKNVSYGQYPVTNSREINNFFHGKAIYNEDTYQLVYDSKEQLPLISQEELLELMDFIKEKHTYINRIESLLDFLARSYSAYGFFDE